MKILGKINSQVNDVSTYNPGKPIEEVAKEFGIMANDIIKLASNENALGTSPKAIEAIKNNATQCFRYPEGSACILRNKLAKKLNISAEQIIIGNGSNEILTFIGHCFMNDRTSTVFSSHSFAVYKLVTQLYGARIIEVPMIKTLVHDIDEMVKRIDDDTSVIFICNPNNPTGTKLINSDLDSAIREIPDDVLIVIDEAYAEVALEEMPDTLSYLDQKPNVIICRTFSKAYGLAGLRLGYGIGHKSLIQALQKVRQPFNVNLIAQVAGTAALDDDDFIRETRQVCRDGRQFIEDACHDMDLKFIPTTANFMLIEVENGALICLKLLEKGIIVRSMESYGLSNYIRVTFGRPEENQKFVDALREAIANPNAK